MPTVAFFNGVMVRINVRDHPPPHCHVFYSGHKAVFSIDPVLLTHGQLPPAQRADVLAWMTRHQAELRQAWMDCQAQQIATSIPYP